MTHLELRCRCGGEIRHEPLAEVPPPPGALLATTTDPPEQWRGWRWVCDSCGAQTGLMLDYGTLDLGIVRDSQLKDRDFQVFPDLMSGCGCTPDP